MLSGWRIEEGLSELMGQSLSRNLNHSARSSIIGNVNIKLRCSVKDTSKYSYLGTTCRKSFILSLFFFKEFKVISWNIDNNNVIYQEFGFKGWKNI